MQRKHIKRRYNKRAYHNNIKKKILRMQEWNEIYEEMHFKVNTYIFDMGIYSAYELRLILPDSDGDSLLLSFQIV